MPLGAMLGGSLISGLFASHSADKAADAQTAASHEANQLQRYMFNRTTQMNAHARGVGNNALSALAYEAGIGPKPMDHNYEAVKGADGTYSVNSHQFDTQKQAQNWISNRPNDFNYQGFQQSPGYQFRVDQGNQGIERMAAARGLRLSGSTLKAADDYNQGMASSEYGNYINHLQSLGGVGQTATAADTNAGQNYANAFGQNVQNAGNAQASGYMGQNNAFQGTMNNLFGGLGMAQSGMFGANPGFGIRPSPAGLGAWGF